MSGIQNFFDNYLSKLYLPTIAWTDIIEIIIIAFVLYSVLVWIKNTKAWVLLKGIVVVLIFAVIAYILNLRTILWIASKTISVGIIALVVIFQPELRRALEQLGRKNIVTSFLKLGDAREKDENFSEKSISELIKGTFEMAAVKTGALIVIERDIHLEEYIKTGIEVDGIVTSQLLVNIFEHNTPLHDGAVIVRGNRAVAATCYLPLSDNVNLSKELGTRHRAGVGISEVSDSFTIIVSEETGFVSIAEGGKLERNVDRETLKTRLEDIRNKKKVDVKAFNWKFWRGKIKDEREDS